MASASSPSSPLLAEGGRSRSRSGTGGGLADNHDDGDRAVIMNYNSSRVWGCMPWPARWARSATAREWRHLLDLSGPLIVGYAAVNAMTTTDLAFVGQLGAIDLAAMNLANAIMFGTLVLPVGLSSAVRVLAAQCHGALRPRQVGLWVQVTLVWTLLICVVPISLAWWFAGDLVCLLGLEEEELEYLEEEEEGSAPPPPPPEYSAGAVLASAARGVGGGGGGSGSGNLLLDSVAGALATAAEVVFQGNSSNSSSPPPPPPPAVSSEFEGAGLEMCDKATDFGRMSLLWLWLAVIYNTLVSAMEAVELVLPVMWISIVFVFINLGLNAFFLLYLEWGLVGSALATTTSKALQLVVLCLVGWFWCRVQDEFWGGWTFECLHWVRVRSFLKLGVPMALTEILYDWTFEIAILLSGTFSIAAAGATGVLINLIFFFTPLLTGIYIAVTVRVSTLLGEYDVPGTKRAIKIAVIAGVVVALLGAVFMLALRNVIPRIYTDDDEVLDLIRRFVPLAAVDFVLSSFTYVIQGVLEGSARPHAATISAIGGTWAIGLPLSFLLAVQLDMTLLGLFLGLCIGEAMKLAFMCLAVAITNWDRQCDKAVQAAAEEDALLNKAVGIDKGERIDTD